MDELVIKLKDCLIKYGEFIDEVIGMEVKSDVQEHQSAENVNLLILENEIKEKENKYENWKLLNRGGNDEYDNNNNNDDTKSNTNDNINSEHGIAGKGIE